MILLVASLIVATMLQAPIPAQQSSPDVVQQARGILAAIVAGDFATVEKQFTNDMKAALPPGALAAMWAKLLNQFAFDRAGRIAGTGASLPAEYQIPGHVAEEVIRDLATWITTAR